MLSDSIANAAEVCFEDGWGQKYTADVEWCSEMTTAPGSSTEIGVNSVHVNLTEPTPSGRVTREDDGNRTTSSAAALLDSTVSLNGDFFGLSGDPKGLSVGNVWHPPQQLLLG
jgi:hypothetical protein